MHALSHHLHSFYVVQAVVLSSDCYSSYFSVEYFYVRVVVQLRLIFK